MVATAVDLSNLPPLVTPPGTVIVHQSALPQGAVVGHRLTQPTTAAPAQVISYEAYAPPPQPQTCAEKMRGEDAPAETCAEKMARAEKMGDWVPAPALAGASSSKADAAAAGRTEYI